MIPQATLEWPTYGYADDVRPALARALAAGPCVLATLYAVEGAAPRALGTQMLIGPDGLSGFLSGGCVESDVALHAARTLEDGRPRRLVYGQGSPWYDIQLVCGARIDVLLERLAPDDPAATALAASLERRRPVVWFTDGERRACLDDGAPPDGFAAAAAADMGDATVGVSTAPFAIARRHLPRPRLIVVGGDPTAMAIAQLGALSGLDTTLVRPSGPKSDPPLAGVRYRNDDPAAALDAVGLDPWTSVAVATHDLEADEAALVAALPSPAAYVGVLGARRRLPERRARLSAAGVGDADLDRLRAPIGLPLGGKAPWEIAVSVIGEIIASRSGADA